MANQLIILFALIPILATQPFSLNHITDRSQLPPDVQYKNVYISSVCFLARTTVVESPVPAI